MGVDPISLAVIGLTVASGVMKFSAGARAKKAAERQAAQASKAARINAENKRRDVRRVLGKIKANAGASGIEFSGSALDALEDSALEGEQDAQIIEFQGRQKAESILQKGRDAKVQGSIGMLTSFAQAGLAGASAFGGGASQGAQFGGEGGTGIFTNAAPMSSAESARAGITWNQPSGGAKLPGIN